MSELQEIEMAAGQDPEGNTIVERIQVRPTQDQAWQLVRSPAFIQGLASGDVIKLSEEDGQFEIVRHSGNLSIRVYCRGDTASLSEALTPELEKLGGEKDYENPRMLVYSIHVSCGFSTIEAMLNRIITLQSQAVWRYGNVYDPKDGITPLNWWLKILQPE